jgi:hypothetical protein
MFCYFFSGLTTIIRNARGVVKGYKAAKKRLASDTNKLPILFSTRLGGAIGVNRRSFIDEIVVHMRQHAPLIGVETWTQVPKEKKDIIVQQVLVKISSFPNYTCKKVKILDFFYYSTS